MHPGLTRTEATAGVVARAAKAQGVSEAEVEKNMANRNLVRKLITAEEIAHVVTFLASPKAIAINGDSIAAGGGSRGQHLLLRWVTAARQGSKRSRRHSSARLPRASPIWRFFLLGEADQLAFDACNGPGPSKTSPV